jgi:hypothetical protein
MDQLFSLGHVSGVARDARRGMSKLGSLLASLPVRLSSRPRFRPDNFTLALIGTVVLASLLPCRGAAAVTVDDLTNGATALLFFLHGAKLSRETVIAAASLHRHREGQRPRSDLQRNGLHHHRHPCHTASERHQAEPAKCLPNLEVGLLVITRPERSA